IPILSVGFIGVVMLKVLGIPIAHVMTAANGALKAMSTGNIVILAMLLRAMIAFDMGGRINKTAFFFGAAMIREGDYRIMGACAAAICTPPLGMGLATVIRKRLWGHEEQDAGIEAVDRGRIRITSGTIWLVHVITCRVC